MGNCFGQKVYIEGQAVHLNSFMNEIYCADAPLFNELLQYYDETDCEIKIKINVYKDMETFSEKCIDSNLLENKNEYYTSEFKIRGKDEIEMCCTKIIKTKYGVEELKERSGILGTYDHIDYSSYPYSCKINNKFLILLEKHQNIEECRTLYKLLCYTRGIDYTQYLNRTNNRTNNSTNNRTNNNVHATHAVRTAKIGEPDEPSAPH